MNQNGRNWPPQNKKDENIEVEYTGADPKLGIPFKKKETLRVKGNPAGLYETAAQKETFMPFLPDIDFNEKKAVLARLDTYKQTPTNEILSSGEPSGADSESTPTATEAIHKEEDPTPGHVSDKQKPGHKEKHNISNHPSTAHDHAKESFTKKWGKRAGDLFAGIFGTILHFLGHMWKRKPDFDLGNGLGVSLHGAGKAHEDHKPGARAPKGKH